jgi:hypothetical protein
MDKEMSDLWLLEAMNVVMALIVLISTVKYQLSVLVEIPSGVYMEGIVDC